MALLMCIAAVLVASSFAVRDEERATKILAAGAAFAEVGQAVSFNNSAATKATGCLCVMDSVLANEGRHACNCCLLQSTCEESGCTFDEDNNKWGISWDTSCRSTVQGVEKAIVNDIHQAWRNTQASGGKLGCTCVGASVKALEHRWRCGCCMLQSRCVSHGCAFDTAAELTTGGMWAGGGISLSEHACRAPAAKVANTVFNSIGTFWDNMVSGRRT